MPAATATAPGKIILLGEHAVVYGRPALAVPVTQVQARAIVTAEPRRPAGEVHLQAPDLDLDALLDDLPPDQPLALAVRSLQAEFGLDHLPACTIRITSTIPIAAGLGSGAAVSVALLRALSAFLGYPLLKERVSALAYEVEKLHHGSPSGIDNTVITYALPVYFMRGNEHGLGRRIEPFRVGSPFTIVIGDTGIASPTSVAVGDLRRLWESDRLHYEALFDRVGQIVAEGRQAIESGWTAALGPILDENHALLQQMGVSSPELDHLVAAAREAGALGAKLSGGGRGGNMIALTTPATAPDVAQALQIAGAPRTLITEITPPPPAA